MAAEGGASAGERRSLLALCTIGGVSWSLLAREAQRPGGLERMLAGEVGEDSRVGRRTAAALAVGLGELEAGRERVAAAIAAGAEVGARLLTVLDRDYPSNLRAIAKPPPFLFVRGELRGEDARSVAVVGTRRASAEGLDRARWLARALVGERVTVVSGLARGIDTAAHSAALEAGGRTVAVIGTGILRTYPAENRALAERIVERGAIVSQFWPDAAPARYSFPLRNEVMSGISQGTAVIEAGEGSGAKMQAGLALEQGRRVFLASALLAAEPWARDYLARRGAIEVGSAADLVGWLRSSAAPRRQPGQQLAIDWG